MPGTAEKRQAFFSPPQVSGSNVNQAPSMETKNGTKTTVSYMLVTGAQCVMLIRMAKP